MSRLPPSTVQLPFRPGNIWDVEKLREKNNLNTNFENANKNGGDPPLAASVAYFGVNQDSQLWGTPLPPPFDSPDWTSCHNGAQRAQGYDWCVTNVVSRQVPACDQARGQVNASAPICTNGTIPTLAGCTRDAHTQKSFAQWQCLPPVLALPPPI